MQKFIVSFCIQFEINHIKGDNVNEIWVLHIINHLRLDKSSTIANNFLQISSHVFIFMDVLNVNYDQYDIHLNKRDAYSLIR
jgi:hypothetical protein